MKKLAVFIFMFVFSTAVYPAPLKISEAWDEDSDPQIMSYYYVRGFSKLPLSGQVDQSTNKLWSGNYWSLSKGNINYRWYSKNKKGFNLDSPDKQRLKRMSIAELAELAPSEKYDLFTGRYDYPLRNEVNKIANPSALIWEGICHGWSPATINHNEPLPKLMINPDGIAIPFGSSDIKALISYYYAHGFRSSDTHQMGKRCFEDKVLDKGRNCWEDLNAGSFHIILTNRLGIDGKSFVADLNRFKEVWNHPLTAFESRVVSEDKPIRESAKNTVKTIRIQTTITYLDENGNDWHPVIGTSKQEYKKLNYEYRLDIDSVGSIIGGNWISKDRPDFLWMSARPRKFEGSLSRLEELLDD